MTPNEIALAIIFGVLMIFGAFRKEEEWVKK